MFVEYQFMITLAIIFMLEVLLCVLGILYKDWVSLLALCVNTFVMLVISDYFTLIHICLDFILF